MLLQCGWWCNFGGWGCCRLLTAATTEHITCVVCGMMQAQQMQDSLRRAYWLGACVGVCVRTPSGAYFWPCALVWALWLLRVDRCYWHGIGLHSSQVVLCERQCSYWILSSWSQLRVCFALCLRTSVCTVLSCKCSTSILRYSAHAPAWCRRLIICFSELAPVLSSACCMSLSRFLHHLAKLPSSVSSHEEQGQITSGVCVSALCAHATSVSVACFCRLFTSRPLRVWRSAPTCRTQPQHLVLLPTSFYYCFVHDLCDAACCRACWSVHLHCGWGGCQMCSECAWAARNRMVLNKDTG
jgi:hypothetical protein